MIDHHAHMQSHTRTVICMLRPARCDNDRMRLQLVISSAADRLIYVPWYYVTRRCCDDWISSFSVDRVVIIFDGRETKRAALHVVPVESIRQIWLTSCRFHTQYFHWSQSAYLQHLLVSYLCSYEQIGTSARCDILRLRDRSVRRLITGHAASRDEAWDRNIMLNTACVYCALN